MPRRAADCRASNADFTAWPLLTKLERYLTLTGAERAELVEWHTDVRTLPQRRDLVTQGRQYDCVHILCSGVAFRFKVLSDGRRQILNIALPGDLLGFPSCLFEDAINSVGCATNLTVVTLPLRKLLASLERCPRIATALLWASSRDMAMYGERLVDIGRRSAEERLAHMLLELLVRLRDVGLAEGSSYRMPVTQEALADALGLSGPHVSRLMRALREQGLLSVARQRVTLRDPAALSELAGFDAAYLAGHRIPDAACA